MPSPPRHFPPPWSAEVQPNYYVVRDADGQQLAYIYYSNDPDRRSAAKLLTKDEARRIAANIAKLPELLRTRAIELPVKQPFGREDATCHRHQNRS